jgi:alpha-beta hydrolase superfamily lysophospholipase
VSPVATDGTFNGTGDVPIYWRRAAPDGAPRAVVLLAHGYAEHVGRYEGFFAHATGRGLAVAALDHRGHGRSAGQRGHCADFAEMVADLRTLADMASGWWPGVPRVLFGHSMGGLISFLYLLRHPDTVIAGALSAPAFGVPSAAPWPLEAVVALLGRIVPRVPLRSSLDESALARDPAVGRAYVADPLVHRAATAGFFRAFRSAQALAVAEASRLEVPLLVLQGDADRVVQPGATVALTGRLTGRHELVMLPGYYHELLNEPISDRAKVLELVDGWFDRWLGSSTATGATR